MTANWYDNFMATPVVGIKYQATNKSAMFAEQIILEFCDKWDIRQLEPKKWQAKLSKPTGDVFLNFKPGDISISPRYACRITSNVDEPPTVEMTPARKYEEILDESIDCLKEFWNTLCEYDSTEKLVTCIGIVIIVEMKSEDIPPGLRNLILSLQKIWNDKLESINGNFISIVDQTDSFVLKCHHTLNANKRNEKEFVALKLDFQNFYKSHKAIDMQNIGYELTQIKTLAFEYFDKFGLKGANDGR